MPYWRGGRDEGQVLRGDLRAEAREQVIRVAGGELLRHEQVDPYGLPATCSSIQVSWASSSSGV